MSRIIDNGEVSLAEALDDVLPHANGLDACVGYFNLRGWRLLRSAVRRMPSPVQDRPSVRLLVGMAISPDLLLRHALEDPEQPVDLTTAVNRAHDAIAEFARQLTWGIPTKEDENGLRALRDDLRSGVLKVKFFARHPLHAKLYVAHVPGGPRGYRHGIVGSSNFTSAGLDRQGELSLEETDEQVTRELAEWFYEHWGDQRSIDVTEDLIQILDESWVRDDQPKPYHVYLRMAWELSRDARQGLGLDIPNQVKRILLPHQISAVQVATRILERKGIAVIGDVVGLGKTLTGTAIAATMGDSVLVIAPKNLVKMWQKHLLRFDVPGKVLSLSMVEKDLPDLRRFRLVVIDESRNLRNRQRKAWVAIHDYIQANDSRVVLLTATLFNARHRDIGSQMELKIPRDQPLGIQPEKLIAEQGAVEVASRTNGRLDTLAAFDLSEHNEDWQRLLSEFLIRRTRKFLEKTYGHRDEQTDEIVLAYSNGETFRFPHRIPRPLHYPGGPDDPNDRLATEQTVDDVNDLTYARYQLGKYLTPNIAPVGDTEQALLDDLQKSVTAAAGFIRTIALKRLTSSAYAFILTVKRMIARNAVLDYAISNRLDVPLGNFAEKHFNSTRLEDEDIDPVQQDGLDVPDPDGPSRTAVSPWGVGWSVPDWLRYAEGAYKSLRSARPAGVRWARADLFKTGELLRDVRADSAILQHLVDQYGVWDVEDDTKLRALAGLINDLSRNEKVLVFSEYKDTIDYVAAHLPAMTDRSVAAVSGTSADPTVMARRFAPVANTQIGGLPAGQSEIDVLLATDVLSEGQNLQDAAIVVNWDLPWTIIKVVQRAGRVDRVGQQSRTITVYSFLPQAGVESVIHLFERLKTRLQNSEQILGGGEHFFGTEIDVDISGLFDGNADLSEDEGQVDASSHALSVWESAAEPDQRAARALQPVVSSTRWAESAPAAALIALGRTTSGTDLLVRVQPGGEAELLTPMEALTATAVPVDEAPAPRVDDHLALMGAAREAMDDRVRQGALLLNQGLRKRLHDFLVRQADRLDLSPTTRDRVAQALESLQGHPLLESARPVVNRTLRGARAGGPDDALERLLSLADDHALVDTRDATDDRLQLVTAMGLRPRSDTDTRQGGER
jgi:hypothetical protein